MLSNSDLSIIRRRNEEDDVMNYYVGSHAVDILNAPAVLHFYTDSECQGLSYSCILNTHNIIPTSAFQSLTRRASILDTLSPLSAKSQHHFDESSFGSKQFIPLEEILDLDAKRFASGDSVVGDKSIDPEKILMSALSSNHEQVCVFSLHFDLFCPLDSLYFSKTIFAVGPYLSKGDFINVLNVFEFDPSNTVLYMGSESGFIYQYHLQRKTLISTRCSHSAIMDIRIISNTFEITPDILIMTRTSLYVVRVSLDSVNDNESGSEIWSECSSVKSEAAFMFFPSDEMINGDSRKERPSEQTAISERGDNDKSNFFFRESDISLITSKTNTIAEQLLLLVHPIDGSAIPDHRVSADEEAYLSHRVIRCFDGFHLTIHEPSSSEPTYRTTDTRPLFLSAHLNNGEQTVRVLALIQLNEIWICVTSYCGAGCRILVLEDDFPSVIEDIQLPDETYERNISLSGFPTIFAVLTNKSVYTFHMKDPSAQTIAYTITPSTKIVEGRRENEGCVVMTTLMGTFRKFEKAFNNCSPKQEDLLRDVIDNSDPFSLLILHQWALYGAHSCINYDFAQDFCSQSITRDMACSVVEIMSQIPNNLVDASVVELLYITALMKKGLGMHILNPTYHHRFDILSPEISMQLLLSSQSDLEFVVDHIVRRCAFWSVSAFPGTFAKLQSGFNMPSEKIIVCHAMLLALWVSYACKSHAPSNKAECLQLNSIHSILMDLSRKSRISPSLFFRISLFNYDVIDQGTSIDAGTLKNEILNFV